jgi:hypothetical protein
MKPLTIVLILVILLASFVFVVSLNNRKSNFKVMKSDPHCIEFCVNSSGRPPYDDCFKQCYGKKENFSSTSNDMIIPRKDLAWNIYKDSKLLFVSFDKFDIESSGPTTKIRLYWKLYPKNGKFMVDSFNAETLSKIQTFELEFISDKFTFIFRFPSEFWNGGMLSIDPNFLSVDPLLEFRFKDSNYLQNGMGFLISKMVKPYFNSDLTSLNVGEKVYLHGFNENEKLELTVLKKENINMEYNANLIRNNQIINTKIFKGNNYLDMSPMFPNTIVSIKSSVGNWVDVSVGAWVDNAYYLYFSAN